MCTFAEKLRICRQAFGLSQEQLADALRTTKQVISHYERGDRTPKIDMAAKYADVLDVPVEYLVNNCLSFRCWELDELEDYWNSPPSQRIHIVTLRGVDPRIAKDYKQISTIKDFVQHQSGLCDLQEQEIISHFRLLNSEGKSKLKSYLDDLLSNEKNLAVPTSSGESAG